MAGLDNSFVILNSWHRTDRKSSVEERLGETLAESGVSILITSITNILSFYTAVLAPYPYVQVKNYPEKLDGDLLFVVLLRFSVSTRGPL